jgi:O-antigen ligase
MSGSSSILFGDGIGTTPERIGSSAKETVGSQKLSLTATGAGFFFSFRAILVLVTARWLRVGTEAGVIAELLIGSVVLLLSGFLAIGLASRPVGWAGRIKTVRWVIVFLSFSCCSLLWSATISTAASFFYWSVMATDVTTVVLLLRSGPVTRISHSVLKGFICSTCILSLIAWTLPVPYDLRLGDPEFFNTNQIGNLCAMGIFMAQFLSSRKDGKWGGVVLLLNLTLLRSLSKATLAALVISQIYILLKDPSANRKRKALLAFSSTAVVLIFWGLIGAYYSTYTAAGQAETLTGRTAIWAYTLDAALQKPWVGNGIDSMWKVFPPFGWELFEPRHAENELLQQFFAYGVVGIVMLIGLYATLYRRIRKLPIGRPRTVLMGLMIFIVIRGLAEAEPFDLLLPLWMITLMSVMVETMRMPNPDNRPGSNLAVEPQLHLPDISVQRGPSF